MEELLAPVSTSYRKTSSTEKELVIQKSTPDAGPPPAALRPSSPEEALEALRAEPGFDNLRATLEYIIRDEDASGNFKIRRPGPVAGQLVHTIASSVVPSYWPILSQKTLRSAGEQVFTHAKERELLLSCLRSLAGVNATLTQVKLHLQHVKDANNQDQGPKPIEVLSIQVDLLETLLKGDSFLLQLWEDLANESLPKKKAAWHEITVLLAGGRVVNYAAEATDLINQSTKAVTEPNWISNGSAYTRWLAQNVIRWFDKLPPTNESSWKPLTEVLSRATRLGHPGRVFAVLRIGFH
jgi:telomere length regulation protein